MDVEAMVRRALEAMGPEDGLVVVLVPRELADAAGALEPEAQARLRVAMTALVDLAVATS